MNNYDIFDGPLANHSGTVVIADSGPRYPNFIFLSQRALVVNGGYEPNDEECLNPWRDENEEDELARAVQSAAITDGTEEKKPEEKPAE